MSLCRVLAVVHWLSGLAAFFVGSFGFVGTSSVGDRNGYGVLVVLGLLLVVVGVGLHARRRWLVALGAIPVAAAGLVFSALLLLMGSFWSPPHPGSLYLLSLGGFLVAIMEAVALFVRVRPAVGGSA